MNAVYDWLIAQTDEVLTLGVLAFLGALVWHKTEKEPRGSVREWFDEAKARQYGQPGVYTEVLDHFDARNDAGAVL